MRTIFVTTAVVVSAVIVLLLAACASRSEAPDPVTLQEEIAAYRSQELELVRATVLDAERAGRLIELLGERDRSISVYVKKITTFREQMSDLNADYNANRESFDQLLEAFNSQRAAGQKEFTDLIAAMKMETTAEEWKVISKFQVKRLDPRHLTYGQAAAGG